MQYDPNHFSQGKGRTMDRQNGSDVLDRAIEAAVRAHSGTLRKKEGIPYILHPMEVAVIAGTMTGDPEVLAAAVLHDTVEDTSLTMEDIREAFGDRVASLVSSETEDKRDGSPAEETWKIRKQESLEHLRRARDMDVKILWLSDKLSNLRSIHRLWRRYGDGIWESFHEKRVSEQAWYYHSIGTLLEEMSGTDARKEYMDLVEKIFGRTEV